jgi:nucleoid-associated protein YgaU
VKKVLATAVLASLIAFGSGCNNDKKKPADVTTTPQLETQPPVNPYVPTTPPGPSVMAVPNNAVAPAPMAGTSEATPVKSTGTKTHSGTHSGKSTASSSKITGGTYTIKAGDTLQKISLAKYGTTKRWKAILKANPQIKNPDKLIVGQKIKLP